MLSKIEIKYLGNLISYGKLRDVIIDECLTQNDTIILNSIDFENIALDYREFYHESFPTPHLLLNVLIRESSTENIPINRVGILRDDFDSVRSFESEYFAWDGEQFYVCRFCGQPVEENGTILEGEGKIRAKFLINQRTQYGVNQAWGKCCKAKYLGSLSG